METKFRLIYSNKIEMYTLSCNLLNAVRFQYRLVINKYCKSKTKKTLNVTV